MPLFTFYHISEDLSRGFEKNVSSAHLTLRGWSARTPQLTVTGTYKMVLLYGAWFGCQSVLPER